MEKEIKSFREYKFQHYNGKSMWESAWRKWNQPRASSIYRMSYRAVCIYLGSMQPHFPNLKGLQSVIGICRTYAWNRMCTRSLIDKYHRLIIGAVLYAEPAGQPIPESSAMTECERWTLSERPCIILKKTVHGRLYTDNASS